MLDAVTEMALAGNIGAILEPDAGIALHAWAFGEDQARYVVTSANGADISEAARAAGVPVAVIGRTGGDSLALEIGNASLRDRVCPYGSVSVVAVPIKNNKNTD